MGKPTAVERRFHWAIFGMHVAALRLQISCESAAASVRNLGDTLDKAWPPEQRSG